MQRGAKMLSVDGMHGKLHGWWPWLRGFSLGNVRIPPRIWRQHCAIIGQTGSGKSTVIRQLLAQLAEAGEVAIVVDPGNSELVQEFYEEKRGDILLNPLDGRFPGWAPGGEIRDESFAQDVAALTASLIRDAHERNPFVPSAKRLLTVAWEVIEDRADPDALGKFIRQAPQAMAAALKETRERSLINVSDRYLTAKIDTALNAVTPFSNLPPPPHPAPFSVREWTANPPGWLWLSTTSTTQDAARPGQGVLLDMLMRGLLSRPIGGGRRVWVVADEFTSLGVQPQLERAITEGRKADICVVLGFQTIHQLDVVYGYARRNSILDNMHTKLWLANDGETAELASKQIGEYEEEAITSGRNQRFTAW